jgi:hypothetical protein
VDWRRRIWLHLDQPKLKRIYGEILRSARAGESFFDAAVPAH